MTPELSLFVAIAAILLALVTSLVIWSVLGRLQQQLQTLRQDARANNSATYGLTRHIRHIQTQVDQKGVRRRPGVSLIEADKLMDQGIDTLQLADELGVSQDEAEIISHLRPSRTEA